MPVERDKIECEYCRRAERYEDLHYWISENADWQITQGFVMCPDCCFEACPPAHSLRITTPNSSMVDELLYRPRERRLSIVWANGDLGAYLDVPPAQVFSLRHAAMHPNLSVGKYINSGIKPNYEYVPE